MGIRPIRQKKSPSREDRAGAFYYQRARGPALSFRGYLVGQGEPTTSARKVNPQAFAAAAHAGLVRALPRAQSQVKGHPTPIASRLCLHVLVRGQDGTIRIFARLAFAYINDVAANGADGQAIGPFRLVIEVIHHRASAAPARSARFRRRKGLAAAAAERRLSLFRWG